MSDFYKRYNHLKYRFKEYFNIPKECNLIGYDFVDIDNMFDFVDEIVKEKDSIIDSQIDSILKKENIIKLQSEKINILLNKLEKYEHE